MAAGLISSNSDVVGGEGVWSRRQASGEQRRNVLLSFSFYLRMRKPILRPTMLTDFLTQSNFDALFKINPYKLPTVCFSFLFYACRNN